MSDPLLEVQELRKHFVLRGNWLQRHAPPVRAVDGVSFTLDRGETLAVVGESGCGKTTLGRLVLRLIEADAGSVRFDGMDMFSQSRDALRRLRRRMQIIFQDPYSSLNPRMTVGWIIGEALRVHGLSDSATMRTQVASILERVGLDPECAARYPHEFSGGQRQRIGIARALALTPELIVCDEVVSALDVSIQAQIIQLLQELQRSLGLSYLFISHDLNVVRYIADRVIVMYLGQIVEEAPTRDLYRAPRHPYTRALLQANPLPDPERVPPGQPLAGDIPSASDPPPGCRFHTRCPDARPECRVRWPTLDLRGATGRRVACHLYPIGI